MTPVTREEMYLYALAGGSITLPSPVSRKEMYLAKACGEAVTVPTPVSREEMYLYKLAGGSITLPSPVSRLELLMAAACGEAVTPYTPVSRLEWFWSQLSSPTTTISGVPPLAFTADGRDLTAWIISGNSQQAGTPTPDAPVAVQSCGDWDADANSYKISITCGSQSTPVYLGQVQTVRRVKKKIFTGDTAEDWHLYNGVLYSADIADYLRINTVTIICSHYPSAENVSGVSYVAEKTICMGTGSNDRTFIRDSDFSSAANFRTFLAEQNQNGTPLTIWYVLAEPTTGIVNEPLCKIGDYADTVASTNTGAPSIPTVNGSNTLTIGTTLQPSSISITGYIS